jgi:hypothetical protein
MRLERVGRQGRAVAWPRGMKLGGQASRRPGKVTEQGDASTGRRVDRESRKRPGSLRQGAATQGGRQSEAMRGQVRQREANRDQAFGSEARTERLAVTNSLGEARLPGRHEEGRTGRKADRCEAREERAMRGHAGRPENPC